MNKDIEKLKHDLYIHMSHANMIYNDMICMHKIICPAAYSDGLTFYENKRDESKPLQTKSFYQNKIVKLFNNAERLTYTMYDTDEICYGITRNDIKQILQELKHKKEYRIT